MSNVFESVKHGDMEKVMWLIDMGKEKIMELFENIDSLSENELKEAVHDSMRDTHFMNCLSLSKYAMFLGDVQLTPRIKVVFDYNRMHYSAKTDESYFDIAFCLHVDDKYVCTLAMHSQQDEIARRMLSSCFSIGRQYDQILETLKRNLAYVFTKQMCNHENFGLSFAEFFSYLGILIEECETQDRLLNSHIADHVVEYIAEKTQIGHVLSAEVQQIILSPNIQKILDYRQETYPDGFIIAPRRFTTNLKKVYIFENKGDKYKRVNKSANIYQRLLLADSLSS